MTAIEHDVRADGAAADGRTLIEASAGTGKTYSIAVLVTRFVAGDLAHNHDLAEGVDIDEVLVVTYTRAAAAELRDRIRAQAEGRRRLPRRGSTVPPGDEWLHRVRRRHAPRPSTPQHPAAARPGPLRRGDDHHDPRLLPAGAGAERAARRQPPAAPQLIENDSELIAEVVRDLLLERLADSPLALSPDRQGRPLDHRSFGPTAAQLRRPLAPGDVERYVVATVRAVLSNPGARCEPDADDRRPGRRLGGVRRRCRRRGRAAPASAAADRLRPPRQRSRRRPSPIPRDGATARRPARRPLPPRPRRRVPGHRPAAVGDLRPGLRRSSTDHRRRPEAGDLPLPRRRRARLPRRRAQRRAGDAADQPPLRPAAARRPRPALRRCPPRPCRHRVRPRRRRARRAAAQRPRRDRRAPARRARRPERGAHVAGHGGGRRRRPRARRRRLAGAPAARHRRHRQGPRRPSASSRRTSASSCRRSAAPRRRPTCCASGASRRCVPAPARCCTPRPPCSGAFCSPGSPRRRMRGSPGPPGCRGSSPSRRDELVETAGGAATADGDSPLAGLQRRLATLGERMRRDGVGAVYEHLRATPALLDAVLGRPNGDRDLTDLDHLAELLVAELAGKPAEPAAVAEAFDRMIAAADDQSEATMRRVETDGDAVHITTVHSAKGLEYPVVLVPFAYTERPAANRPYVFNDEQRTGRRRRLVGGVGRRRRRRAARRRSPPPRSASALATARGRRRLAAAALRRPHPRQAPPRGVVGPDPAGRDVGAGTPAARPLGCRPGVQLAARRRLREAPTRRRRASRSTPSSPRPTARSPASTSPLEQPVRTPAAAARAAGEPARCRRSRRASPAGRSGAADVVVHGDHRRPRRRRRSIAPRRAGGRWLRRGAVRR